MAKVDPKVVNIWTSRVIPFVLMGVVGYATYVLVVRLCVDYLLNGLSPRAGTVIALLIIYFLLFLLMSITYFRLLYIVTFDPGFVPLGRAAPIIANSKRRRRVGARNDKLDAKRSSRNKSGGGLAAGGEYATGEPSNSNNWHTNADSPGLEEFYSKDVFVCEQDGRPKWCTECGNWKPDRTHHCSDVGRCVRKMDHFCPWVGGVVAENSFKFFIQFVAYTAVYCIFILIVMAYFLHEQLNTPDYTWDTHFAAILGLATFFGLFTFGMTSSSAQFALSNLSTIENLNKKTKVWQLAVFLPDPERAPKVDAKGIAYPRITYPLPLEENEKNSPSAAQSDSSTGEITEPVERRISPPHLSERDAKAQRTFAILHMEPGRSPWDLGASGNWKSVMGNNVLDWFLPVNRSPCCNHESDVSQFQLGAWFEQLVVNHGLMPASEMTAKRPVRGHLPKEREREIPHEEQMSERRERSRDHVR